MDKPELLAAFDGRVEVEYSQFHVEDEGSAWYSNDDVPSPEPPDDDDLVRTGIDWICIASEAQDHTAGARLETWSSQPEWQSGWEVSKDFDFACTTGRLFLNSLTMGPSSDETLTVGPPGNYHGRIYSRGRQEARDASRPGDIPEGLEYYLIQFWPA